MCRLCHLNFLFLAYLINWKIDRLIIFFLIILFINLLFFNCFYYHFAMNVVSIGQARIPIFLNTQKKESLSLKFRIVFGYSRICCASSFSYFSLILSLNHYLCKTERISFQSSRLRTDRNRTPQN